MRLDLVLPAESPTDSPAVSLELAVHAEQLGYGAVWLPDHLLPPAPFGEIYGGVHEPLLMLAAIAARTSRIRLGTSVLIAPLREPVLLAKQAATLDALAPGRVLLGVGAGWERAEFDALGVSFGARGAGLDATIRAVRSLHASGRGPAGQHFRPLPRVPVPVVVGGTSDAALRRAARLGDVWQGLGLDPAGFAAHRDRLDAHASGLGRRVLAGTRIARRPGESVQDLRRRIEQWRAVEPDHLAVHLGEHDKARTLLARLRPPVPS